MPKTAEELEAERIEAEKLASEAQEENKEEAEDLSPADLKAKLAEAEKKLRAANAESADRRKKLEALEKEEADRKTAQLSEAEKLEARANTAEAEKLKLENENRELRIKSGFAQKIRALKLFFVNDQAEEDAFRALDLEAIGEDPEALLEPAIKKIVSDRPYLFTKTETQSVNDGSSKGKARAGASTKEAVEKKRIGITPI